MLSHRLVQVCSLHMCFFGFANNANIIIVLFYFIIVVLCICYHVMVSK